MTRGGLAAALNEIALDAGVGIEIEESAIPVTEPVAAACELLGLDPLYVANEGRLVAFVPPSAAEQVLEAMGRHPAAVGPCRIGTVTARTPAQSSFAVVLAAAASSICSPANRCRASAKCWRPNVLQLCRKG